MTRRSGVRVAFLEESSLPAATIDDPRYHKGHLPGPDAIGVRRLVPLHLR
jgi:hypothetical protein